ncbi:MAG: hypothetical protein IZT59_05895 [Verrucomicrobia bacterium]|nr:hypothetical protein [Verrucomicrobiota bacterium]
MNQQDASGDREGPESSLSSEKPSPNELTIRTLKDSRDNHNLERFDSVEEIFESW